MRVSFHRLLWLTALLAGSAATAQTGALHVRVYDVEGAPLPGATVTLSSALQLVPSSSVTTDPAGRADFPILRAGEGYALDVSFPGYARQKVPNLRVRIGDNSGEIPIRMTAEIQEQVQVIAERGVVDLDSAKESSRFSDRFIADLPVQGRLYQNVLTLAPGVLDADEDGNPNVHGGRSRDFKALVSGVSNVDPLTGEWLSYVNPDSIEEVEVIPSGAGVEYGRAQAGFAQVIQKQGSNEFEGVVNVLYVSSRLDRGGATNLPPNQRPQYDTLQPAVQFTGPIIKDKLWFRFSHERVEREDPVNIGGAAPLTTVKQVISSDQITWQASPRNKLALRYEYDPKSVDNYGLTSRIPPESSQRREYGGPTWSLTHTGAYSPKLLVDSVVAYQDERVNILPETTGVANDCVSNLVFPALDGAQCFFTNQNRTSGSYYISSRDHRQRFTVRSQADYFAGRFWGATHRIKFGWSAENERYFRTLQQGSDALFTYFPLGETGEAAYRLPVPPVSKAALTGMSWGLYAEDQVRPLSNLSINVGLRFDSENIDSIGRTPFDPEAEVRAFNDEVRSGIITSIALRDVFTAYEDVRGFTQGLAQLLQVSEDNAPVGDVASQSSFWPHKRKLDNFVIRNRNLAPRFSIIWDPGGEGKSKVAFSAGRYYGTIFLAVPLIEVEPVTTFLSFTACRPQGQYCDVPRGGAYKRFVVPDYYGYYFKATINARTVDRNLRTPHQDEVSLSYEREVAQETALKVTLLRRRFRDQLQDTDLNHLPQDFGRCVRGRFGRWTLDTSHGGDGVLDDCAFGGPDGVPDLYVLNPGWGEIMRVGNVNTADYNAIVIDLVHRFYRNWQLEGSYTLSHAVGNAEDFNNQIVGVDRATVEDGYGILAYDQRHVFKVSGTTILPGGVRMGGNIRYESGLPFSILESGVQSFVTPPALLTFGTNENRSVIRYTSSTRNDRRSPPYWTFDARIQKEWNVRRSVVLGVTLDAFNMFNDDTIRIIDVTDGTPDTVRRFGRKWQLGLRLAF